MRIKFRFGSLAVLAFVSLLSFGQLVAAQTASFVPAEEISRKADEYMTAAVRAEKFSGAVLIAENGKAVFSHAYGMANFELDVPNKPETIFQIASLTKAFTAASIMQLQEKGKLSIADSICKYLDNCPETWQPVTIRNLLTHTSGIPNYTNFPDYVKNAAIYADNENIVARFRDKPLDFAPGTETKYSNSGYHLLGMIVEKASGQTYEAYLQQNIFDPLDMRNSGRITNKKILKNRAEGYMLDDETLVNADLQEATHIYSEGGIYSTLDDMLKWDQALYTEKILTRKSLDEIFTPFKNNYGYGWNITKLFNRREYKHTGLNFGFTAHIKRFPDDHLTVIVLSNNQTVEAEQTAESLAAIAFGINYRIPREYQIIPARILETYAGEYEVSPTIKVAITLENGKLFAQGSNQGKSRLYAASETKFFVKNSDVEVLFIKDIRGQLTGISVLRKGSEIQAGKKIR